MMRAKPSPLQNQREDDDGLFGLFFFFQHLSQGQIASAKL